MIWDFEYANENELIHHDIEGRSYIETINQEQDEPLLFFPSEQVPT